ncbi:MAG TPA: dockerin type I domain-containing protein [Phycisphaerae bacterium]|nr:dockerin type I domain-containing protein [Phycisphaerae bacterium]
MCVVKNGSVAWFMVVAVCASTGSAAVLSVGAGQTYSTVQAAVNAAVNGDTIEIHSGTYTGSQGNASISKSSLTLRGVGATRPILDAGGTSTGGKAIWVIGGSNTTVESIEFRNCTVPDQNGAGIRQEGTNLTVRYCYFHDNEDGILGGGNTSSNVLVEYSEFYNNGYGDGYSHNMYISNVGSFTLRHSWSHHAYVGHEVKTRARVNYIEYNRITNETGNASYEINIPNGGTSYIIGNMVEQGPYSQNSSIISYAEEGASNPDQHLYVINNTIVNNRGSGTFVRNASAVDCLLQNNIFQGAGTILNGLGTQVTNWVTSNAYLADGPNYDYHLTASSTGAIDAGSDPGLGLGYSLTPVYEYLHPTDRQSRPSDAMLDIGAYEFAVPLPILVSSEPPADGTLPKTENNIIVLTFDFPIALPVGDPLLITELGDPNNDVSGAFTYAVEADGVTLKAVEDGPQLADQTWYRVTPSQDFAAEAFTLDVCTLQGDANNSGRVTTADYSEVKAHLGEYTDSRYDLNGSGRVTTADYSVVKAHLGIRAPAKP